MLDAGLLRCPLRISGDGVVPDTTTCVECGDGMESECGLFASTVVLDACVNGTYDGGTIYDDDDDELI